MDTKIIHIYGINKYGNKKCPEQISINMQHTLRNEMDTTEHLILKH